MTGFHQRDELNQPLGLGPAQPRRSVSYRAFALLGCVLIAAGLIAFLVRTDNRFAGEPYAVAAIDQRPAVSGPPAAAASRQASTAAMAPTGPPANQMSASQIEAQSGVKVVRNGGGAPPGALIIEVPEAVGLQLNAAPDQRLVEKSRYGLLPRIGADGARPADVYARPPLVADNLKGAPRIALLVGGLGLSEEGTAEAIRQLPGAVSLGFAPYGAAVERLVAEAREAGHETLLQAPMEPFDYATNNPGPHTLLSSASETQVLDDLHWLMARFQGYVGVTNFLGAKFTADQAALAPALRDIATRGLLYVDDGSSPRSLARSEAARINLPAVTADVVIDAAPKPQAIDEALIRLEALARANGSAVGVATALPISVEHISRWARSLEARGLALTPISAIVTRGPGPAAEMVAPDAPAVSRR
jgi:polysaccharide deacetylase 2 family uncharacterized protein YibQ